MITAQSESLFQLLKIAIPHLAWYIAYGRLSCKSLMIILPILSLTATALFTLLSLMKMKNISKYRFVLLLCMKRLSAVWLRIGYIKKSNQCLSVIQKKSLIYDNF